MFSLTKILNRLYLTKFSFYLLLALILISFSITFYLMLPNNNLVKNPLQLQYFLLADVFFVILLLALIIRQLILIIIYRKNQKDESKLYIKFVNLFTAMAVGPAIGLVVIELPFLSIKVSGEQLTIEKFLSLIIKDSGAAFAFINFQNSLTGSIKDLFLYFVQIFI